VLSQTSLSTGSSASMLAAEQREEFVAHTHKLMHTRAYMCTPTHPPTHTHTHTHSTHTHSTHTHTKEGSTHLEGAPGEASLNYCHGCWRRREPLRWERCNCPCTPTNCPAAHTYPTTLTNTHLSYTHSSSKTDG